ncbi:hypothetical protein BaRGS_00017386 [Batillaria attramentaria]|uniref:15-hydroxyprostaglandin dehydrogenase [NAD(+)] n=1 Tax=Batillaria attramentaria TaxID=370345 RepID=A0ABD0KVT6_9CAEN
MDLRGKGVFLTGGARGIGRGLMEALLSKGARVLFCDVNSATGKATEAELQEKFGAENVIFRECDVTNPEQLKAVDICVNNAAVLDESALEKMFAVNAMGQIRGSQLALEHMRRDRGGRGGLIINIQNSRMKEMGVRWRCFCPRATQTDFIKVKEGMVQDIEEYLSVCLQSVMKVSEVAEEFLKVVQDEENNDVIYLVQEGGKSRYVRRQLIDSDGVSNPLTVDNPQPAATSTKK